MNPINKTISEIYNRVLSNLSQNCHLRPGDKVVIGVSGGADSMCLLDMLAKASATLRIEIVAVHVNHRLRGHEADRDHEHVRNYCNSKNIHLICKSTDIKQISKEQKISEEEAGRNERYRIFREAAQGLATSSPSQLSTPPPTFAVRGGAARQGAGACVPGAWADAPGAEVFLHGAGAGAPGVEADTPGTEVFAPGAGADAPGAGADAPGAGAGASEAEGPLTECARVWIAVAHNKNDLAETVMLNILRGTGVDGLSAMEMLSGDLIRPMLNIYRSEIEAYLHHNGIHAIYDSSNKDCKYTRNRIRARLLPDIRMEFNPNIENSLAALAETASWDSNFLRAAAWDAYLRCRVELDPGLHAKTPRIHSQQEQNGEAVRLNLERLKELHMSILARVVRIAASDARKSEKDFGAAHTIKIIDLILGGSTGKELHLPGGIRARKTYDCIVFYVNSPIISSEPPQHAIGRVSKSFYAKTREIIEECNNIRYNSQVQYFDAALANPERLILRARQEGDRFFPLGSPGTKKLKKYFIDRKIPRETRDSIPVLVCDNDVLWVVGYGISGKYKVTDRTETVMKVEYSSASKKGIV